MKVTVKSLAQAAGVSRGTVDRVLHNRGAVKEDVAKRVRLLAKELGYVPNRAGRALAAYKTPIKIGALMPSVGNAFYQEIIQGINDAQREFQDLGLEVVLKEVVDGPCQADHRNGGSDPSGDQDPRIQASDAVHKGNIKSHGHQQRGKAHARSDHA